MAFKRAFLINILILTSLLTITNEAHATVGFYNKYVNVSSFTIQQDGKIIVAGEAKAGERLYRFFLVRLNDDGSLDLSFPLNNTHSVENLALQPDGKILAVLRNRFSYKKHYRLIRFNSDGTIDSNFTPIPQLSRIKDVAVQSDGKIIIAGDANTDEKQNQNAIYRLYADGRIDKTFKAVIEFDKISKTLPTIEVIALESDGKILIGGRFNRINGQPSARINRLHNDGSIDVGFKPDIDYPDSSYDVRCLAIQPDGKILMSGMYEHSDNSFFNFIYRLNPNGSMDSTFDSFMQSGEIRSISVQSDGKILIGGYTLEHDKDPYNGIIRIKPDGSEDVTFKASSRSAVYKIIARPNSKILVGGMLHAIITDSNIETSAFTRDVKEVLGLVRLDVDGSVDETFKPWTDNLIKTHVSPDSAE